MKTSSLFLCLVLGVSLQAEIRFSAEDGYSQEQAMAYCREQGTGWRVMGIKELYALPATTPFADGYSYWSSDSITSGEAIIGTGSEGDGGVLEVVGFSFYPKERNIALSPQWKKIAAACTDDPALKKQQRQYKKVSEGTLDPESGVIWHDLDATDKRAKYTYSEAEAMCEHLSLHGRTWRLPTTEELYGIVDYAHVRPTVDMAFFGPVMHRYYWTSDILNDKEAFVVGFKLGSVATAPKKESAHARCVSDSE